MKFTGNLVRSAGRFTGNLVRSAARFTGNLVTPFTIVPPAPVTPDAEPHGLGCNALGCFSLGC